MSIYDILFLYELNFNKIYVGDILNIVLYCPEIPQNTGNIARTCVVSGSKLHLIKPLGFKLDEKHIKRAGLDYWDKLELYIYENFEEFEEKNNISSIYLVTTKGKKNYSDFTYSDSDFFLFGKETKGLPEYIHNKYKDYEIKIPMIKDENARCLNLSNSVSIIVYEALRQNNFNNLS